MTAERELGRVARRKRDTLGRIARAADELFAAQGFDATTTQQISDRADIAAGTLFRYASTKTELLLLVYNDRLREAIRAGRYAMESEQDATEAILAYATQLLRASEEQPRNTALFQRELIFADSSEQYRAEGLVLVDEIEHQICDRLLQGLPHGAQQEHQSPAFQAARSIFADVHMLLIQPHRADAALQNDLADLRLQIEMVVDGFLTHLANVATVTDTATPLHSTQFKTS